MRIPTSALVRRVPGKEAVSEAKYIISLSF
jgi:hypothetical protein